MTARAFSPADIASAKAWPFEEARKLDERLKHIGHDGVVLFETGYGPSGPPHIGTFGEVARTTMVRRAFEVMTGRKTRLISFSDDMDGMRKVPPHLPNQEMLGQYLQKPLTTVPDPWGSHESFAHHNNAKLRAFLDQFGFDYEFVSATEQYRSGKFDATLVRVLERYGAIMEIMLPSLGDERKETYSPILPISPKTGRVLYVPLLERNAATGEIVFEDEDGERIRMPVTGGRAKLQWKADWAGRWFALGVDYEMAGEDLTESVRLSNRIVKAPTSTGMSNKDGTVSERLIRHYREQASGGVGLLVVEYAFIDEDASKSAHCQLGISTDDHISGLAWLAEVIKEQGARAAIQLEHCGRQKFLGTPPIKAASAIPWPSLKQRKGEAAVPKEMTLDEIKAAVASFGDAARRAKMAGFDLVEIGRQDENGGSGCGDGA